MTDRQKELARRALGLNNPKCKKTSYRNRFIASAGHADFKDWSCLVAAGQASFDDGCFYLTREGATLALSAGEKLDKEDFPVEVTA